MTVTRDTLIIDVIREDIEAAQYFFDIGMHCVGCPSSRGESIEMACMVHGVDADELVEKLNAHFAAKA